MTSPVEGSRRRGLAWFVIAGLAVVIAGGMLFTDVAASDRADAASCGAVLSGGERGDEDDEDEVAESDSCELRRADRASMALTVVVVGGFLLGAGVRDRRYEPDRTLVSLGLFLMATALLLWPQTVDRESGGEARCGAPLLRGSDEILELEEHDELAECGVDRSKRVSWALVWSVVGTLVLVSRRPPEER